jgi:UDP-2,4-diacetamido-2,4,6-trideoxy-beta-L-altropyranose hydrolase
LSHRLQQIKLKGDFPLVKARLIEQALPKQVRQIVYRADAGLGIGTGHVMRCLTLADALQAHDVTCVFVTRLNPGHIVPSIIAQGHEIVALPARSGVPYGPHPAPPSHAHWLGADWRDDARATRECLEKTGAAWLVMDHYALDRRWQEAAMPEGVRLLVIDDLADRPHLANMLLDQNAGREAADYGGLVPETCDLRIGPTYALLRPEFQQYRPQALARREALERPETVLVTLGGIDQENATGAVLDVLADAPEAAHMKINVVMGAAAPHLDAVKAKAAAMTRPVNVAVNVSDMARRMMEADLCIGAAGATAWERCALGLPALQMVLAENQIPAARHMAEKGLAHSLPFPDALDFAMAVRKGLAQLSQLETYRAMSKRAAALTDGAGSTQLTARIMESMDAH